MPRVPVGAWVSFAVAGLWHRRGIAIMVLATTMLAAGAASAAFIYRDAAATSGLRTQLGAAAPQASGVVVSAGATPRYGPSKTLDSDVGRLPSASDRIVGTSINTYLSTPGKLDTFANLLTSTGLCGQVTMVTGTCPTSGHKIALPVQVAAALGLQLGHPLLMGQWPREANGAIDTDILGRTLFHSPELIPPVLRPVQATLVGTYQVTSPAASYWMGSPPVTTTSPTQALPATILATPKIFAAIPHFTVAQVFVAQPLRTAGLLTSETPALRRAITSMQRIDNTDHVVVATSLPQLLDSNASDRNALSQITLVSVAQLLALLALVLVVVISVSATSRRIEMMAADLRGRHPLLVAAESVIEPVALVLAGSVAGAAVAPIAVRLTVGHWLLPGTPIPLLTREGALGVAAVAGGGVLVAMVIALWTARRTSILAGTRPTRPAAAWWEIAVFTIAVGGLIELLTAGGIRSHTTPWALVAPSVCGLAVALLLARGLPPLLGPLVSRTRRTKRLSIYLLVRELRRDVTAWRVTAVVAMSVSLLAFAVAIDRGAVTDRKDRAGLIVGADRVVSVGVPSVQTLQTDVQRLDPDGRWAMAAAEVSPLGSPSERTLAVDAGRLPAVAGWSRPVAGLTTARLAKAIEPIPAAPYLFRSTQLRLPVIDAGATRVPISLTMAYVSPKGADRTVLGQTLRAGQHVYRWATPGCAVGDGCRLMSLTIENPPRHQAIDVTIGGIGAGPWTVDNVHAHKVAAGWRLRAGRLLALYGPETLLRPEAPAAMPAVASPGEPVVVGFDSNQPRTHVVAHAAALPRLLNSGSLVDLSYLQLADHGANPGTTQIVSQIWLGDRAPANAMARIQAMHIKIEAVSTRAEAASRLGALDPALGLDAYLAVAALAVLLALALLGGQSAASARRRRREYIALAAAGVSRFSLGCGWFAAAVVRLAFCVGAGSAAGLFVARLAASGVPLASHGTVPAPILAVQTWPAVVAAAATLLPLMVAEALSVRWSTRTIGLRQERATAS